MLKSLLTLAMVAAPTLAAAQIVNPVTNPDTASPSTSYAVPRVGENVDEATAATERSARRDARTPGPTTLRDRRQAAAARKRDRAGSNAARHHAHDPR